jgi:hypothetical protein
MARMRNNPYVEASSAVVGAPPRLLELDAELQEVLTRLLAGVEAQARQLDVLARERADTMR